MSNSRQPCCSHTGKSRWPFSPLRHSYSSLCKAARKLAGPDSKQFNRLSEWEACDTLPPTPTLGLPSNKHTSPADNAELAFSHEQRVSREAERGGGLVGWVGSLCNIRLLIVIGLWSTAAVSCCHCRALPPPPPPPSRRSNSAALWTQRSLKRSAVQSAVRRMTQPTPSAHSAAEFTVFLQHVVKRFFFFCFLLFFQESLIKL